MAQGVIRVWAQKRNISVGARGRLPRAVLDAYREATGGTAPEAALPEQSPSQPTPQINTYEPLADFLEPRFGNIYDWENKIVPYVDEDGFDVQPWTDELREAVTEHLLHKITDTEYAGLLQEVGSGPSDDRAEQVAWITRHNQPWEVAYGCHIAAIRNAPTLDAVIRRRPPDLGPEDLKGDVVTWLEAHATYDQLVKVVRRQHLVGTIPAPADYRSYPDPELAARDQLIWSLVCALPPEQLLDAWDSIAGTALTDLTDEEWELLKPLLGYPTKGTRETQRQAINGMLFQHAHRGRRLPWPSGYVKRANVEGRKVYYRRYGTFARMLTALEGNPEAARITAWLRSELGQ